MVTTATPAKPRLARALQGTDTPSWLRRTSVLLALIAVVAGVLSLIAVLGRSAGTSSARTNAEPLIVDVRTAITSLSDADATSAGMFLAGRVPPAAANARFNTDLARASAGVADAARLAGGGAEGRAVRTVAVGLPVYAGLIQTAIADQRQGLPVAASYLGEASGYLRSTLLATASAALTGAQQRLSADRSRASRPWIAALALIVALIGLGVLVRIQYAYSRRFRRTYNIAALLATGAALLALVWAVLALTFEAGSVHSAGRQTSVLTGFTRAQILAYQARADDELTLVTRDSVPGYQTDYASVTAQLGQIVNDDDLFATSTAAELTAASDASADSDTITGVHNKIRSDDGSGQLPAAIALATGTGSTDLPQASTAVETDLDRGSDLAQQGFSSDIHAAGSDLDGLAAGALVLALIAGVLVIVGAEQRRGEYR